MFVIDAFLKSRMHTTLILLTIGTIKNALWQGIRRGSALHRKREGIQ